MNIRSILSSSIGNLLEWYDFGLFAFYSTFLANAFFPESSASSNLLKTFGIFAVGFLCRPLGAILFGFLGDTRGRTLSLRVSILMISLPTLLIGCIPSYQSIGIYAPLLLVLIRLWQGISLGGEFSGNLIYLVESAPKDNRGLLASFAPTGANLGMLLAAGVVALMQWLMPQDFLASFGWRIPYFLSGILSLLIYFMRTKIKETDAFTQIEKIKQPFGQLLKSAIKNDWQHMLKIAGLVCMGNTFYYMCFVYMPSFIHKTHFIFWNNTAYPISLCLAVTFSFFAMLFLVPLGGFFCDVFGRKRMLLANTLLIALMSLPAFYFLVNGQGATVLLVVFLLTVVSSFEQATTGVAVVENYPLPIRCTGLSLGYNIGVAVFSGTAPFISEWLMRHTHSLLSPAWYIIFCAFITGIVILAFIPETKHNDINQLTLSPENPS